MHQKEKLIKVIETEEAIAGLREDDIIHVYYKPNTEITVTLQNKMLDIFNELTNGKKSLFIFEAGNYCSVTREARDNAIAMEPHTPLSASVVVAQNMAHKLIADFYYKINKPIQPYKVVSNFEDGIVWLKSLVKAETV